MFLVSIPVFTIPLSHYGDSSIYRSIETGMTSKRELDHTKMAKNRVFARVMSRRPGLGYYIA